MSSPSRPWSWFLALSLPLFILDQITKSIIVARFADPRIAPVEFVPVIDGFFNIVRVHNTGVAFGMFNGTAWANVFFTVVASTALVFITVLWYKGTFPTRIGKIAAALLVSGVIGNLTDRLFRGYVVDFLDFILPLYDKIDTRSGGHFPSFNVADSCITVAAVCLFISAFQKQPQPATDAS